METIGNGCRLLTQKEYDENFEIEFDDYVENLEVDIEKYPELIGIIEQGRCAPIPSGWGAYATPEGTSVFFYCASTGEKTIDHPLDNQYKELFKEEAAKIDIERKKLKKKFLIQDAQSIIIPEDGTHEDNTKALGKSDSNESIILGEIVPIAEESNNMNLQENISSVENPKISEPEFMLIEESSSKTKGGKIEKAEQPNLHEMKLEKNRAPKESNILEEKSIIADKMVEETKSVESHSNFPSNKEQKDSRGNDMREYLDDIPEIPDIPIQTKNSKLSSDPSSRQEKKRKKTEHYQIQCAELEKKYAEMKQVYSLSLQDKLKKLQQKVKNLQSTPDLSQLDKYRISLVSQHKKIQQQTKVIQLEEIKTQNNIELEKNKKLLDQKYSELQKKYETEWDQKRKEEFNRLLSLEKNSLNIQKGQIDTEFLTYQEITRQRKVENSQKREALQKSLENEKSKLSNCLNLGIQEYQIDLQTQYEKAKAQHVENEIAIFQKELQNIHERRFEERKNDEISNLERQFQKRCTELKLQNKIDISHNTVSNQRKKELQKLEISCNEEISSEISKINSEYLEIRSNLKEDIQNCSKEMEKIYKINEQEYQLEMNEKSAELKNLKLKTEENLNNISKKMEKINKNNNSIQKINDHLIFKAKEYNTYSYKLKKMKNNFAAQKAHFMEYLERLESLQVESGDTQRLTDLVEEVNKMLDEAKCYFLSSRKPIHSETLLHSSQLNYCKVEVEKAKRFLNLERQKNEFVNFITKERKQLSEMKNSLTEKLAKVSASQFSLKLDLKLLSSKSQSCNRSFERRFSPYTQKNSELYPKSKLIEVNDRLDLLKKMEADLFHNQEPEAFRLYAKYLQKYHTRPISVPRSQLFTFPEKSNSNRINSLIYFRGLSSKRYSLIHY